MKKSEMASNMPRAMDRHKSTFIVKIEYCQHGTWQGKVIWAEENRTERFRSALELLKLMNEAVAVTNNDLKREDQTCLRSGTDF